MCDTLFIDGMRGIDGVQYLLFSEEIDTDVFSDLIYLRGELRFPAEGFDSTKRFAIN